MHAANYYREVGGGVCAPIYPIKSHSLAMLLLSSKDLLLSCLNSLLGKLSQNLDANPLPELHFPYTRFAQPWSTDCLLYGHMFFVIYLQKKYV